MRPEKRAIRGLFRTLFRIYFRGVEVVGEPPDRATGGRVFASNHKNALIDPTLILVDAKCDVSPLAKSTLWKIPGLTWLLDLADAVPVLRRKDDPNKAAGSNDEIFDRVAQHLANGGNILVFPEGTSHNEPHMARLKSGAARMLDRARSLGAKGLTFQAVGLEYDERHAFRAHAVVAYGPVRDVPAADAEGGDVESLTQRMHDDLEVMVVEGETWEERRLILKIAEVLRNERRGDTSFAEAVEIAQGVERARDELRKTNPALATEVAETMRAYLAELDALRVSDEVVIGKVAHASPSVAIEALKWVGLPLAPIGAALYFLPYQLPRMVARRTDEVDQHATLKFATGVVAYPVWAALLGFGAFRVVKSPIGRVAVVATLLASPFAALTWKENLEDLRRSLRLVRNRNALADLLELRRRAMDAILRAEAATSTG